MQALLSAVLGLCVSIGSATAQKSTPEIVKSSSDAVVLIVVADAAGKETALGSGFIVSSDGKIITNLHVVRGSHTAIVKMANGAFFPVAGVLGEDENNDLAVLKVNGQNLPRLPLSQSPAVVGEHVVAIGSPEGLQNTVSDGIVSGIRELTPGRSLIQTTAPISPGSSGGPLLNGDGEVLGVIRAYFADGQNLNVAVPVSQVQLLLAEAHNLTPLSLISTSAAHGGEENVPTKPNRPAQPEKSHQEILAEAKSIYIFVRNGSPVLEAEISKKLIAWGKLEVLTRPELADLVLEVSQTGELNLGTGAGNQATATLKDYHSGVQLWSTARGGSWAMSGFSNAWVGRAIAKDLINFLSSVTKRKSR